MLNKKHVIILDKEYTVICCIHDSGTSYTLGKGSLMNRYLVNVLWTISIVCDT